MTVRREQMLGLSEAGELPLLKARPDDRTPAKLREMPNEALSALGQREIIDHYPHISADFPRSRS